MNPMISIVIPVYNSELNLNRCISSISSQDYYNFEILIVNDGSTDETDSICKEMTKRNCKIKYFSQNNFGPGSARNLAMKHASGEYLIFIDSDDTVEQGYFKKIVEIFENWNGNVIQFGYQTLDNNLNKVSKKIVKESVVIYDSCEIVRSYGNSIKMDMFLWSKAFRRDSFGGLFFKDYYYGEDQLFLTNYFYNQNQILIHNGCFYNYILSKNSLVRSSFNVTKIDGIFSARDMYVCHCENCKENKDLASEKISFYISSMYKYIDWNITEKRELIKEFNFHFNELKKNNKLNEIPIKRRLLFVCFKYYPKLTSWLYNIRFSYKWSTK